MYSGSVSQKSQDSSTAPRLRCPLPSRLRTGQVMIEYMIGAVVLVGAVTILAVFLYTMRENGARVFDLVSSEYP
jgi:hypothetical protein